MTVADYDASALHYQPLHQLAPRLRTQELAATELAEHMLQRIDELDGYYQSYATVMAESALEAARQADAEIAAGSYRGPLHGMPVAVKDLLYTKGARTMGGLKVRRNFIPDFDATVVQRLRAAGAVILGKLNLTEGALSGYHPEFPIPVNPHGETLWSGVSSSGSGVAVAAGLCFAAIGTDTGGSIRYPSMANGIVGLKPTYGRVSRYGVIELAGSMDHIGPMTRSVKDAALVFDAIAGHDISDSTSLAQPKVYTAQELESVDISSLRLGVDKAWFAEGSDADLVMALESTIELISDLGVQLVEISMPRATPMELRSLWLPLCGYEAARAHADTYPAEGEEYGPYLSEVLDMGLALSDESYREIQRQRKDFSAKFIAALESADAVICPAGGVPFSVDRQAQRGNMEQMKEVVKNFQGQFTIPADLAGVPGLTFPIGTKPNGWPLSAQLLGPKEGEGKILALAAACESRLRTAG